jgi:hypothetical protein
MWEATIALLVASMWETQNACHSSFFTSSNMNTKYNVTKLKTARPWIQPSARCIKSKPARPYLLKNKIYMPLNN